MLTNLELIACVIVAVEVQDGYSMAARPIRMGGNQDVVVKLTYHYKTQGGRNFFEFLMTPEGQKFIDPATDDMARARAASKTCVLPTVPSCAVL